jgi:uncharacterized protein (DUF488 family)
MPTLLTIGYENHRVPESLVTTLREAGVQVLVDVRELPLSRRRGFSKKALGAALDDAGIDYRHERALGNPKAARDLWRFGNRAEGERLYRAHVSNGSAWAVDELSVALQHERTCILCVEADHRDCHRSVIVEELQRRLPGLRVKHL